MMYQNILKAAIAGRDVLYTCADFAEKLVRCGVAERTMALADTEGGKAIALLNSAIAEMESESLPPAPALQLAGSAIEAWDHALAGKPERELVEVLKVVRDALVTECGDGGWISVKERLPEDSDYIAFVADNEVHSGQHHSTLRAPWIRYGTDTYGDNGDFNNDQVTYWRLMPAPPTAKEPT